MAVRLRLHPSTVIAFAALAISGATSYLTLRDVHDLQVIPVSGGDLDSEFTLLNAGNRDAAVFTVGLANWNSQGRWWEEISTRPAVAPSIRTFTPDEEKHSAVQFPMVLKPQQFDSFILRMEPFYMWHAQPQGQPLELALRIDSMTSSGKRYISYVHFAEILVSPEEKGSNNWLVATSVKLKFRSQAVHVFRHWGPPPSQADFSQDQ